MLTKLINRHLCKQIKPENQATHSHTQKRVFLYSNLFPVYSVTKTFQGSFDLDYFLTDVQAGKWTRQVKFHFCWFLLSRMWKKTLRRWVRSCESLSRHEAKLKAITRMNNFAQCKNILFRQEEKYINNTLVGVTLGNTLIPKYISEFYRKICESVVLFLKIDKPYTHNCG